MRYLIVDTLIIAGERLSQFDANMVHAIDERRRGCLL